MTYRFPTYKSRFPSSPCAVLSSCSPPLPWSLCASMEGICSIIVSAWEPEVGGVAGSDDALLGRMTRFPFPAFSTEATGSTTWPFICAVGFLAAMVGLPLTAASVEGLATVFCGSASFAVPLTLFAFAFSCGLVISPLRMQMVWRWG